MMKYVLELCEFLFLFGICDFLFDLKIFVLSCEYVNFRLYGLLLCFEGGKLDCVYCYVGCDGFGMYVGGLLMGVALTSAAADVVWKFGELMSKGG